MRLILLGILLSLLTSCTGLEETVYFVPDGDEPTDGDEKEDEDGDGGEEDPGENADGDGSTPDGDEPQPECPNMRIEPEALTFGVPVVPEMVTRSFEIANRTTADVDLVIQGIDYVSDYPHQITLGSEWWTYPLVIRQGGRLMVEVTQSSDAPQHEHGEGGHVVIVSNACSGLLTWVPVVFDRGEGACGVVEPDEANFGQVAIGSAATKQLSILNRGEVDHTAILRVLSVSLNTGDLQHFRVTEGVVDFLNPVSLRPCPEGAQFTMCRHEVMVDYIPQQPTDTVTPHQALLRIVMDRPACGDSAEEAGMYFIDIPLEGHALSDHIIINPVPTDFGRTVIHEHGSTTPTCSDDSDCPAGQFCRMSRDAGRDKTCFKEMPLRIYNYGESNVAFTDVEAFTLQSLSAGANCDVFELWDTENIAGRSCTENTDCPTGMICAPHDSQNICQLPPGGVNFLASLTLRYAPRDIRRDTCTLRIRSTLPDAQVYSDFLVTGEGRLPNVCPTARIALGQNDDPVTQPISDVAQGSVVCFYGATSSDPDGHLTEFSWSVDPAPEGFDISENCYFTDSRQSTLCCGFPYVGEHGVTLRVKDDDGCWSEPHTVTVDVRADQWLRAVLRFSGGVDGHLLSNRVDMDLQARLFPNGTRCDCTSLGEGNACPWLPSEGHAIMPVCSSGSGCCGTKEEIRLYHPIDGEWEFSVFYADDCSNWIEGATPPFCAGRYADNRYTLEFFDMKDWQNLSPLWTVTDTLGQAGESHSYRLIKRDGLWVFP